VSLTGPDSTTLDTSSIAELSQRDEDPIEDVSIDIQDRSNAQKSNFIDFKEPFIVMI
jgi:hypothetical protein